MTAREDLSRKVRDKWARLKDEIHRRSAGLDETSDDRSEKPSPPMISDGIKGDVQNLKDDLNAQHLLDGVPSGIQSGTDSPPKTND